MQSERQRGDKEKREKKRVQKEMDKLNQQCVHFPTDVSLCFWLGEKCHPGY